jgi:hypothetical protein
LISPKKINKIREEAYQDGFTDGTKDTTLNYVAHQEKAREDQYRQNYWMVNPHNILRAENGRVFLGDHQITEPEVKNLQTEIKLLGQMRIWQIFQETIKQRAIEKSVLHSDNWEQVLAGKMMIYNLGIQKSVVEVLHKL